MSASHHRVSEHERRRLKRRYRQLFGEVSEVLFRHDPMNINFVSNTDEYEPEAGTILPRLQTCSSSEEVCAVVHEEFCKWFGESGPRDAYSEIAKEIWEKWERFKPK